MQKKQTNQVDVAEEVDNLSTGLVVENSGISKVDVVEEADKPQV